jgi:hypothetical protein
MADISGSLGALINAVAQQQDNRYKRRLIDSQSYQAQAAGDFDVARANDLTALSRAMAPFASAVQGQGLDSAMQNADLLGPLISAFKTPEALSLLPGATPDNRLAFALAGGNNVTKDSAFSIDDRERMRGADATNAQAAQIAQELAKPITAGPGAIVVPGVGDPRGAQGPITGRTTDVVSKGEMRDRISTGQTRPGDSAGLLRGGSGISIQPDGQGGFAVAIGDVNTPLPKTQLGGQIDQNIALRNFQSTIGLMREASKDPTIFGTVGNARRMVQDVGGQASALSKLFGGNFEQTYAGAAADMRAQGFDPSYFDPNLTLLEKAANLAAYQAASALAGQEGRNVSDKDVKLFRNMVGNPTEWLSTQQSFVAGLDQLDQIVSRMLVSTNRNINVGADTSAGSSVTVDGVSYTITGRKTKDGHNIVKGPDGAEMVLEE